MTNTGFRLAFLAGVLLFVAGCTSSTTANPSVPATFLPTEDGNPTQMSTSTSLPPDPNLQDLIQKAKEDLAQRVSVPVNQIDLVDAQEVVWPDSSLGCPEEGMAYAQVLTPGYLIRLQSGNQGFEYHASRKTLIYCENPSPPVPGTPENT